MNTCVIVGGGELESIWARGFMAMHKDAMTIACDSGIRFFEESSSCPDIFVGDFDSADEETVSYYREKEQTILHQLPVHKDVTDTEEAMHIAYEAGCDPIYLIGMTGGRIDHTLANICLLRQAAAAGAKAFLIDHRCRAYIATKSSEAQLRRDQAYGDYISLIPLGGPVTGLTITGAEYPLEDAVLTGTDSLGISNQFAGDVITITFSEGELLIVEARETVY